MTCNREEFDRVCYELDHGVPLNLMMIGRIFGHEFWGLMVLALSDSRDAGRIWDEIQKAKPDAK